MAAAAFLDRLGDPAAAAAGLPGLASGATVASFCVLSPTAPYALDADSSDSVLVVDGHTARPAETTGPVQPSADPARRLARPGGGPELARGPRVTAAAAHAADLAALLTAAQALGVGRTLLDRTVAYVRTRTRFGVPVGSFQAVEHRPADTLVALELGPAPGVRRRARPGRRCPGAGREAAWPRPRRARPATPRPARPSICTAPSATPPSWTCPCGSARPAPCGPPGAPRPPAGHASSPLELS